MSAPEKGSRLVCFTIGMLPEALRVMLIDMKMDYTMYSLHISEGGARAMAACHPGITYCIKQHGLEK